MTVVLNWGNFAPRGKLAGLVTFWVVLTEVGEGQDTTAA